jgi:chromosome segregation ATPase
MSDAAILRKYLAGRVGPELPALERLESQNQALQEELDDARNAAKILSDNLGDCAGTLAALQERAEKAEAALLEWWDNPDRPPDLAAHLASSRYQERLEALSPTQETDPE